MDPAALSRAVATSPQMQKYIEQANQNLLYRLFRLLGPIPDLAREHEQGR